MYQTFVIIIELYLYAYSNLLVCILMAGMLVWVFIFLLLNEVRTFFELLVFFLQKRYNPFNIREHFVCMHCVWLKIFWMTRISGFCFLYIINLGSHLFRCVAYNPNYIEGFKNIFICVLTLFIHIYLNRAPIREATVNFFPHHKCIEFLCVLACILDVIEKKCFPGWN